MGSYGGEDRAKRSAGRVIKRIDVSMSKRCGMSMLMEMMAKRLRAAPVPSTATSVPVTNNFRSSTVVHTWFVTTRVAGADKVGDQNWESGGGGVSF